MNEIPERKKHLITEEIAPAILISDVCGPICGLQAEQEVCHRQRNFAETRINQHTFGDNVGWHDRLESRRVQMQ